jgi:hypothetical protein
VEPPTSEISRQTNSTRAIYGKHMMFRNILSGKATTPRSVDAFLKAVSEAGQQAKIAEANADRKYFPGSPEPLVGFGRLVS